MTGHCTEKEATHTPAEETAYYVYMLRCRDQSFYTGYTVDVAKRLCAHNAGTGAKYTRSRRPVSLAAQWQAPSKSLALQWEAGIKRLSRKQKEHLLAHAGDSDFLQKMIAPKNAGKTAPRTRLPEEEVPVR